MWVLKDQGASLTHHDDSSEGAAAASGLRVDAGEPCLDEQSFANDSNCVTLNFPSSHDGRGFSFARRVRRERGEGVDGQVAHLARVAHRPLAQPPRAPVHMPCT